MTDEYKETMLDYLTGNLKHEEGTHEEIIKKINKLPKEDWLDKGFLPTKWSDFRYEGIIQSKGNGLFVLYGGFKTKDGDIRGIITILTSDFIPIKTFYQYDSGTYLRYIQCMEQDDEGTFYAVDCPDFPPDENWASTQTEKRFIMLNNFTQQINNEYVLKLNKSYIMPYKSLYCRKMFKDPNSSHYVMVCSSLVDEASPDYVRVRIIDFKINVGSSNEWSYKDSSDNYILGDSYVEFDSDSNSFVQILLNSNLSSSRTVGLWTKGFKETNYTYKDIFTFQFHPYVDSVNYANQSVFLNKNEIYFVQNNQHWGISGSKVSKYIGLYYYNIQTNYKKTIYEKYLGEFDFCNLESIYITQNNNDLYIQYNTNVNNEEKKADYYFQRLDNEWKPIKITEQEFFLYNRRGLYVNNNFNLINVFMYMLNPQQQYWSLYSLKENYNSSNYNGEPYVNDNALIPNSAELYSDSELIFARNLYNKTINDNVTVSTVEIPNTYLNNVNITNKNLLSQTNLHLVKDNNLLQKNIYETVFLNFINAVQVLNKDTETINRQAGVYLNAKINDEKGYDNAKITKVRIRNMDGRETVQSVQIDYPNETISSTNPQLTNSANAELNSIKIDGKTVQNGTPTPDNPVEIKNVKGYRNLWELQPSQTKFGVRYTNNDGKNFSLKGTATIEAAISNYVPLSNFKDGEKYTLTCNKIQEGLQFRVEEYTQEKKWIRTYGTLKSDNLTLTISKSTGYYVRLAIIVLKNKTIDLSNIEIQIIEGEKIRPFVPYGSNFLQMNSNCKNLFNIDTLLDNEITVTRGTIEKDVNSNSITLKSTGNDCYISNTYHMSKKPTQPQINVVNKYGIQILPNTKYTWSFEVSNLTGTGHQYMFFYDENYVFLYLKSIGVNKNGRTNITVETEQNVKYVCFRFELDKAQYTLTVSNVQFEKGDNVTEYNSYQSNSIFVDIKENELTENDYLKIENRIGTIYKTKKTLELNGDESSWMENYSTKGLFQITLDNTSADLTKVHAISTHFIGNKGTDIAKPTDYIDNSICTYTGNRIFFRANSYANNLNGFKQFIKDQKANGTPIIIQYELKTPYTVDLGMQDSIYSYDGTTNISVDDELTPNLEVNYRLEGNYCILTVGIKVKEPLYQLEFISNDETNVYHTVDLSNLEVGKYYVIKQKLEVL